MRLTYRATRRIGVEVDARFDCPDWRTLINDEGVSSIVATHATSLATGRSAIIEATVATSAPLGFRLASSAGDLVRQGPAL